MSKMMALIAGAVVVALAGTVLLGGTVFADGPGPKAGYGDEIGGRDIPLAIAAELTGLTEEQLLAELEGGKTIPALLEEMGIDLETFHQAVADARQAAVDETVDPGPRTTEQAQTILTDGTCDGDGPGPMAGNSYGEPGEGTGSDPSGHSNSYGESSEGAGPGLQNQWGAAWR